MLSKSSQLRHTCIQLVAKAIRRVTSKLKENKPVDFIDTAMDTATLHSDDSQVALRTPHASQDQPSSLTWVPGQTQAASLQRAQCSNIKTGNRNQTHWSQQHSSSSETSSEKVKRRFLESAVSRFLQTLRYKLLYNLSIHPFVLKRHENKTH